MFFFLDYAAVVLVLRVEEAAVPPPPPPPPPKPRHDMKLFIINIHIHFVPFFCKMPYRDIIL
jgi:hypothetical protein